MVTRTGSPVRQNPAYRPTHHLHRRWPAV